MGGAKSAVSGKPVGAVLGAVAILRYLAGQPAPAPNNQIARSLGLNVSTCFNILKTLAGEGLVSFDPASKSYMLGPGLVELASGALDQVGYLRLVHPELERFAARWRVTTTLWLRVSRTRVLLVDLSQSGSVVQIHMRVGQRLPILVGALGRCMAAHADFAADELKALHAALRSDNPVPFDQFLAEVERARQDGYAVDQDHFVRGVTTISSAVLDAAGRPILAISAVMLTAQCSDDDVAGMGADLRETTRRLRALLAGAQLPVTA